MELTTSEILKKEWKNDEDLYEFYNIWSGTPPLRIAFEILNTKYPDWNHESEIGSWGTDFLQDVFNEAGAECGDAETEELYAAIEEAIDSLYDDCMEAHQFSRLNNLRLTLDAGESETAALKKSNDVTGFPILK